MNQQQRDIIKLEELVETLHQQLGEFLKQAPSFPNELPLAKAIGSTLGEIKGTVQIIRDFDYSL